MEKIKIGNNTIIGSNTIIEKNVKIGKIVLLDQTQYKKFYYWRQSGDSDGNKIGQKGFGFIPMKEKNIKFPHIGKVIVKNDVEIATGCTIDRGSIDDTIIGENSYLDNQHVAHNVKIGSNCMIAGQRFCREFYYRGQSFYWRSSRCVRTFKNW